MEVDQTPLRLSSARGPVQVALMVVAVQVALLAALLLQLAHCQGPRYYPLVAGARLLPRPPPASVKFYARDVHGGGQVQDYRCMLVHLLVVDCCLERTAAVKLALLDSTGLSHVAC